MRALITAAQIEAKIFSIRGQKVMLSTDLAQLYGVEPRVLMQTVKRNLIVFPGIYVPADGSGIYKPEITNCDFKLGRLTAGCTICVYRKWP
jgi:hypothetical protein